MKDTVVIGGGLIGITTLHELVRRGEPTRLIEADTDLVSGASFANGALLTPSMSDPWNSPGVGRHLIASLTDPYAPMKLRPTAIPSLIGWGLAFLRNSTPARHRAATLENFHLARRSVARTLELIDELHITCDAAQLGTLKVYSSHESLDAAASHASALQPLGLNYDTLTREAVIAREPALAPVGERFCGGLFYPDDAVGDARAFSLALAAAAQRVGAQVERGVRVRRIRTDQGRVAGVETDRGLIECHRVVVATGESSPELTMEFGISLPIKPAKGYSVTLDARALGSLPRIPVVDDAMHAVVVPLGERLRLVGTAEFAGRDRSIDPQRIDNLYRLLENLYPLLARQVDRATGQAWTGLRPMSADGRPFIGAAGPEGLWINSGHGHLGWTMAAGSAELLVDLMLDRRPTVDPLPFRVAR